MDLIIVGSLAIYASVEVYTIVTMIINSINEDIKIFSSDDKIPPIRYFITKIKVGYELIYESSGSRITAMILTIIYNIFHLPSNCVVLVLSNIAFIFTFLVMFGDECDKAINECNKVIQKNKK